MALFSKVVLPQPDQALPGRVQPLSVPGKHYVNGCSLQAPFPDNLSVIYLGLGCFWGAERLFWQEGGVYTTAVGYQGGYTLNPTYEEVCSGGTGHTEIVMVVYDEKVISTDRLLRLFLESHDPTQGMRQGNDRGTQYRSAIFTTSLDQADIATLLKDDYDRVLKSKGYSAITTEIAKAPVFYYAEEYHQQYLAKNPEGYCGLGGTGVCLPPSLRK
ncbi:peptide-methionine (S)-S-oxide reductase [Endozoicomonas sp. (ex Bugula neritina AB1)]|nr:peptide-methionine (S)-S-oxide reductase [Endozoicomonas sp. (ex Bugula neritina AB1)]